MERLTHAFMKEHSVASIAVIAVGQEGDKPFENILTQGTLSVKSFIPVNQHSTFRIGPLT